MQSNGYTATVVLVGDGEGGAVENSAKPYRTVNVDIKTNPAIRVIVSLIAVYFLVRYILLWYPQH